VLDAEWTTTWEGDEPRWRRNGRNGYGAKAVLTGTGKLNLQIPRDRLAPFDPQLIAKIPAPLSRLLSTVARGEKQDG